MQYHRIPHSSLEISTLGLGTMTFGEQNSEADAHQQLDYAVANGINLIDVAEMYPVPPRPETQGLTETYVGNWLAKRGNREKLVLASKVSGPARNNDSSIRPNHVLGPQKYPRGAARQPEAAADRLSRFISGSLAAAANQLLWQAGLYSGRRRARRDAAGYPRSADRVPARREDPLHRCVERNRLRRDALSALADKHDLPRIVTIQNPYSLLNRSFEVGLAEVSQFEGVELLAYSCLAFGTLTGKYLNGAKPAGARNTLFSRFTRYSSEQSQKAVAAYVDIAKRHGLDPAQMALAFVRRQPFVASTLLGATTMTQLQANVESLQLELRKVRTSS